MALCQPQIFLNVEAPSLLENISSMWAGICVHSLLNLSSLNGAWYRGRWVPHIYLLNNCLDSAPKDLDNTKAHA